MRCCSKKVLYVYAIFIIVGLFMWSNAGADEVYTNSDKLYMKLDPELGGYVVLHTERCEIESQMEEYSYKASIEINGGLVRRACWYRAQPPRPNLKPLVLIVEEVVFEGKTGYNIGSFAQYYFKPTRE